MPKAPAAIPIAPHLKPLGNTAASAAGSCSMPSLGRDVLKPAIITDTFAAWQVEGVPALARREGMEARPGQLKTELVHLTNALAGVAPPASVHEAIQVRQILRKLLVGRVIFEPFEDAARRGYHIRGQATYERLLSGVVSVVPPG